MRYSVLFLLISCTATEAPPSRTDPRIETCYRWCGARTQLDFDGEEDCLLACDRIPEHAVRKSARRFETCAVSCSRAKHPDYSEREMRTCQADCTSAP